MSSTEDDGVHTYGEGMRRHTFDVLGVYGELLGPASASLLLGDPEAYFNRAEDAMSSPSRDYHISPNRNRASTPIRRSRNRRREVESEEDLPIDENYEDESSMSVENQDTSSYLYENYSGDVTTDPEPQTDNVSGERTSRIWEQWMLLAKDLSIRPEVVQFAKIWREEESDATEMIKRWKILCDQQVRECNDLRTSLSRNSSAEMDTNAVHMGTIPELEESAVGWQRESDLWDLVGRILRVRMQVIKKAEDYETSRLEDNHYNHAQVRSVILPDGTRTHPFPVLHSVKEERESRIGQLVVRDRNNEEITVQNLEDEVSFMNSKTATNLLNVVHEAILWLEGRKRRLVEPVALESLMEDRRDGLYHRDYMFATPRNDPIGTPLQSGSANGMNYNTPRRNVFSAFSHSVVQDVVETPVSSLEGRLYANVWTLLRCGDSGKAASLCSVNNQPLKEAALLAWNESLVGRNPKPYGLSQRPPWKLACEGVVKESRNATEMGIFALLAGLDVDQYILPLCPEWEDEIWARLLVLRERCLEGRLNMDVESCNREVDPIQENIQEWIVEEAFLKNGLDEVLACLERRRTERGGPFTREENLKWVDRRIQTYVLLDDWYGLFEYMSQCALEWIPKLIPKCATWVESRSEFPAADQDVNTDDSWRFPVKDDQPWPPEAVRLRWAVHLWIALRSAGIKVRGELVAHAYLALLARAVPDCTSMIDKTIDGQSKDAIVNEGDIVAKTRGYSMMIPAYAALLDAPSRLHVVSSFLSLAIQKYERRLYVHLASEVGLEVRWAVRDAVLKALTAIPGCPRPVFLVRRSFQSEIRPNLPKSDVVVTEEEINHPNLRLSELKAVNSGVTDDVVQRWCDALDWWNTDFTGVAPFDIMEPIRLWNAIIRHCLLNGYFGGADKVLMKAIKHATMLAVVGGERRNGSGLQHDIVDSIEGEEADLSTEDLNAFAEAIAEEMSEENADLSSSMQEELNSFEEDEEEDLQLTSQDTHLREFESLQYYVDAEVVLSSWRRVLVNRPAVESSSEERRIRPTTDRQNLTRREWLQDVRLFSRKTEKCIHRVLQFPKQWLVCAPSPPVYDVDSNDANSSTIYRDVDSAALEERCRQDELSMLRRLCIPKLYFTLHFVLYNSGRFKDSFDLAVMLMQNRQMDHFSPEEVRLFMALIHRSSCRIMEGSSNGGEILDPFGFPV